MTSQKMFYTTLAPNLQTNCSAVTALLTALLLHSASGTVATITTTRATTKLIAICVLATPTLTSSDPPDSAETTHDLSTSLCPLSLSLAVAVALSCSCALSRTHTHMHAHTVQKRRRFIFVSFSFYLFWLFGISLFSSVCGSERERGKKREWEGEKELHLQFAFGIT